MAITSIWDGTAERQKTARRGRERSLIGASPLATIGRAARNQYGPSLPVLWAVAPSEGPALSQEASASSAPDALVQVLLALALMLTFATAYLWQYRLDGAYWSSYSGTYLFGPTLWAAAAATACIAWRSLPRGQHESNMIVLALVVGLFGVAVTILIGVITAMGHSPYAHAPRWLMTNFWYVAAPLAAFEFTRAYLLRRFARYPTVAIAGTAIAFTALGVSYQDLFGWSGARPETVFLGSRLLPDLASNLLASLLVYLGGPFSGIAYRGAAIVYRWYSPVLADPPWLTAAFAGVATPAVGVWVLEGLKGSDDDTEERTGGHRFAVSAPSTAWVLTSVVSLGMLWFSFGFFGVRPSFIPSHSMEPGISAGSIVITKDVSVKDIKVGDVVLYQLNGTNVLHRVVEITRRGMYSTKGDNNNTADPVPVAPEQIRGRLMYDVPYVGWVPIWTTRGLQKLAGR